MYRKYLRTKLTIILMALAAAARAAGPGEAPAQAEEGTDQLIMSLSHPGEPGMLVLQHYKGKVSVTGYDGKLLIVNARHGRAAGTKEGGGMRPLSEGTLRLHGLEKNNVITVSSNSHERTIDLEIQVPRDFSIHLEKNDAGEVEVVNVEGEIDVSSESGGVSLTGISGSAIVSTVDGRIFVRFSAVTPHVPMAFTTASGDIDVMFPEGIDASLEMRSDKGRILTDFDVEVESKRAEGETSKGAGVQRAILGEWTYGSIGAGGALYTFRTYRGDIIIRKSGNLSGGGR